jgi:hypothetical protein
LQIVQGKETRPMITHRIGVALISGVLIGAAVDAEARPPNVTDIALCNQQAQAASEREKPGVPDDARGGVLVATPPAEQGDPPERLPNPCSLTGSTDRLEWLGGHPSA